MAIKTFKPTTPSRRHMTVSAFEGIDKKAKPERSLTEVLKKHAGRATAMAASPSATTAAATGRSTVSSTSSATRTARPLWSICSMTPTAPPTSP